jgi:hypothetical protein
MAKSEPIVTIPKNLVYTVANRLNIPVDQFQEICSQIVEYVGLSDDIDHMIQRRIDEQDDVHAKMLADINDEFAAKFKERLVNLQAYYKSPEWLLIKQNGYTHQINTAHIRALTFREADNHVLIVMGGEQDYLEVSAEQWAERTPLLSADVLNPPTPF